MNAGLCSAGECCPKSNVSTDSNTSLQFCAPTPFTSTPVDWYVPLLWSISPAFYNLQCNVPFDALQFIDCFCKMAHRHLLHLSNLPPSLSPFCLHLLPCQASGSGPAKTAAPPRRCARKWHELARTGRDCCAFPKIQNTSFPAECGVAQKKLRQDHLDHTTGGPN